MKQMIKKNLFCMMLGITLLTWTAGKAWARPCYVESPEDRYTLDRDEPEYTLRDYLWIINQAWREESRDVYGNRVVNPYHDYCRDGTNERGRAVRRLFLTESRYRVEKPLPPLLAGKGETLILESSENHRAVLEGESLRGVGSDCGLYLGLDVQRLWREATDGQDINPNTQVLAEWEETLSADNIVLRNINLHAFPQHALCVAADHIQLSGIRFRENEGAAVRLDEQASGITWEDNEMWQNQLGGMAFTEKVRSREPAVEDVFEEFDSWRIVGSVPDRVAFPYTLEVYLQNPEPDQTHAEGVFLIRAEQFKSRRFEIDVPKQLPPRREYLYPGLTSDLLSLGSSRYYPFTLLVIDRNGKLSGFSAPFRPDDYLGCHICRIATINWDAVEEALEDAQEPSEPEEPVVPETPEPPPAPPPPEPAPPPAPVDDGTDEVVEEEELAATSSCQMHPAALRPKNLWGWPLFLLLAIGLRKKVKDPGG
ncbi:MAG: hypothetical protein HY609_00880 [Deltaproteobacteria bacterium]|nr:hypothetical protein [Deltaproteobacteria bacterium]MBI4223462.1 hypothetical protein [Deltaproteobacteria bacterium]